MDRIPVSIGGGFPSLVVKLTNKTKMRLYKVLFETEVMILAENEREAALRAHSEVKNEVTHLVDCKAVREQSQLGDWVNCLPYCAKPEYNPYEKTCESFVING